MAVFLLLVGLLANVQLLKVKMLGIFIWIGVVLGITLRLFLIFFILGYCGCDNSVQIFSIRTALLSNDILAAASTSTVGQPSCLNVICMCICDIAQTNIMTGSIQGWVRLVFILVLFLFRGFRVLVLPYFFLANRADSYISLVWLVFFCCVPSPLL